MPVIQLVSFTLFSMCACILGRKVYLEKSSRNCFSPFTFSLRLQIFVILICLFCYNGNQITSPASQQQLCQAKENLHNSALELFLEKDQNVKVFISVSGISVLMKRKRNEGNGEWLWRSLRLRSISEFKDVHILQGSNPPCNTCVWCRVSDRKSDIFQTP